MSKRVRLLGLVGLFFLLSAVLVWGAESGPLAPEPAGNPEIAQVTSIVPPPIEAVQWLRSRGLPFPPLQQAKAAAPAVEPRQLKGNVHLLAVMVQFTDNPATVTNLTVFDNLIFAPQVVGRGSVRDFYADASYGQVDLVTVNLPSATNWKLAPLAYSYYVNNNYGWGLYPQNAGGMVADVLPLLDSTVDFSNYDNDGDGWVDTLLVIHAGVGAEFSLSTSDIWSHAASISGMGGSPLYLDGVWLDNYVTAPEYMDVNLIGPGTTDMTIGVMAHELAHGLWGLPDLYDVDGSSYGIGQWGLMSYGDWNGPAKWNPLLGYFVTDGSSPALPSAWSRLVMGFDSYTMALNPLSTCLLAAETLPGQILRFKSVGLYAQEYFLAENRQALSGGYDQYLPGSGLLIWHVDEAMWSIYGGPDNNWECTSTPQCWGNCSLTHYLVALEQADGQYHMENLTNVGDAGDPFPGSSGNTAWQWYWQNPVNPESGSWYDGGCGTDSCIDVVSIFNQPPSNVCFTLSQAYCTQQEADLGDAPASDNSYALPMTAYPPMGPNPPVQANFPTDYLGTTALIGPRHHFTQIDAWLGPAVTGELDADTMPDQDGTTNIFPPADMADMDSIIHGGDDGLVRPVPLAHCNPITMHYMATVAAPVQFSPMPRFFNAWFDWNHDGDWADTLVCANGLLASERAIPDQLLILNQGVHPIQAPPLVSYVTVNEGLPLEIWMRASIAEMQAPAPFDSQGPAVGYDLGETEDHYLTVFPLFSKTADIVHDPAPGERFLYHIHYDAAGDILAQGVVISDVLPAGLDYVSSVPPGSYDPATRAVHWTTDLVPNQPSLIDVEVEVTGSPGDTITNTAYLLWGDAVWMRSWHTLHVACEPGDPQANFTWSTPVYVSHTVTFINQSTGSQPLTYSWDLDGDGSPDSSEVHPTWQYDVTGTFTVTLTVTNTFGCPDTISKAVEVEVFDQQVVYLPFIWRD